MGKKKSHEEFVEELKSVQPNIEVIGEYINTNTPLACKCKIDGHEWSPRPKHLLSKHGCPICGLKLNSQNRIKSNGLNRLKINVPFFALAGIKYPFI